MCGYLAPTGIFSGIFSHMAKVTSEFVIAELGQEFINEFHSCVFDAQGDYRELVDFRPLWASTYTQRFKATFLHERIWARLLPFAESAETISVQDDEPYRVLRIGTQLELRIKKHRDGDRISTYPTREAKYFYGGNGQLQLEGLEPIGIAIGYRWDREKDQVISPVISLQEEAGEKLVWAVELIKDPADSDSTIIHRELEEPKFPEIAFSSELTPKIEFKTNEEGEP